MRGSKEARAATCTEKGRVVARTLDFLWSEVEATGRFEQRNTLVSLTFRRMILLARWGIDDLRRGLSGKARLL